MFKLIKYNLQTDWGLKFEKKYIEFIILLKYIRSTNKTFFIYDKFRLLISDDVFVLKLFVDFNQIFWHIY